MAGKQQMSSLTKILIILAVFIVGTFSIFGTIALLNPNQKIVFFAYISHSVSDSHDKVSANGTLKDFDDLTINKIIVNATESAQNVNVYFVSSSVIKTTVTFIDDNKGLAWNNTEMKYEMSFNANTLTIEVSSSQDMFLNFGEGCSVAVYYPETIDSVSTKTEVSINNGNVLYYAPRTKADGLSFGAPTVDIKGSGNITFTNTTFNGSASLKTNNGNISLSKDVVASSLILEAGNGKISSKNISLGQASAGAVSFTIAGNQTNISLGNVTANISATGNYTNLSIKQLTGCFIAADSVKTSNITIKKVIGTVNIVNADNTNVKIYELFYDILISNYNNGVSKFKTKSGNVTLGTITAPLEITTTSGNVEYTSTTGRAITVNTESGSVDASYKTSGLIAESQITTKSGSIEAHIDSNINLIFYWTSSGTKKYYGTECGNSTNNGVQQGTSPAHLLKLVSTSGKITISR